MRSLDDVIWAGPRLVGQHWLGRGRRPLPGGHERIYLHHVRKTGGTSLSSALLALGGEEPLAVRRRMTGRLRTARSGRLAFAGGDLRTIRRGRYFYGWSHHPAWRVRLPERTFTVTVLRDPAARVISLYRYLADPRADEGQPFRARPEEIALAADGFDAFLDRLPRKDLLNQLHMFSEARDPADAAARIRRCSLVFFTEDMAPGLAVLSRLVGRELEPRHDRRSLARFAPSGEQRARLHELLEPEYALMELLGRRRASALTSPA